ncbi:hypothetical protein GCM10019059_42690 [Camelimonas fluminis]|nr:hypothetical protein GCM10019059_42690 [Camelimonas fluminis]
MAAGYTQPVSAYCDGGDLELYVRPDTDLSQRFSAFDVEECRLLRVNGWLRDFERG